VKPVIFLKAAVEEMAEAARYYEQRREGLGEAFLVRLRGAVGEIEGRPKACPAVLGGVRRKLLLQFPYAVFFREGEDAIVVVAVAHTKRRPGYWVSRMTQ
jgi:plasmid stabilization system protein ParE